MKALKEFDYDLWTTGEEGAKRYWIRIKATGQTTEVSHEVMKVLRNDDRQTRRNMKSAQKYGFCEYSCDADSVQDHLAFLVPDPTDCEADILYRDELARFRLLLTPAQRSVFDECLCGGMSLTEYAARHGVSVPLVSRRIQFIRKKAKKFLVENS